MCHFVITCGKLDNKILVGVAEGGSVHDSGRVPQVHQSGGGLTSLGQKLPVGKFGQCFGRINGYRVGI
jgi:hypothetical protein